MNLNFYLFSESIYEFEQAINPDKFQGENAYILLEQTQDLPFEVKGYFQKNKASNPKWLDFVVDYFSLDANEILNITNSLILLIKIEQRIFAITSGFGFTAINKNDIEHNFGLKVVLNEIDPKKIVKIDSRNIDITTKQKMILINRNSPLNEFDINIQEELISQIGGRPGDQNFGKSFVGSDSLKLSAEITLREIGVKCEQLLKIYSRDTYKENFAFIDNLQLVKEFSLLTELDNLLLEAIRRRTVDFIGIAYPDIQHFNIVERFKIFQGRNNLVGDELDIDFVYDFLNQNNEDLDLQKVWIVGLDNNDQPVTEKKCLYDFMVFETTHQGNRYVFSLNKWFQISNDFFDKVQQSVEGILEIQNEAFLPRMEIGESEGDYNSRASNAVGYLSLDKKNYPAGGPSKIEVCDLLTQTGQFICVKKYSGSSTLSHLFNQGLVSADLLSGEKTYRQFISKKLPEDWNNFIDTDTLDKSMITFVFAIATSKNGRAIDSLPFFSKVSLSNTVRAIKRLDFSVNLYKIQIGNL